MLKGSTLPLPPSSASESRFASFGGLLGRMCRSSAGEDQRRHLQELCTFRLGAENDGILGFQGAEKLVFRSLLRLATVVCLWSRNPNQSNCMLVLLPDADVAGMTTLPATDL